MYRNLGGRFSEAPQANIKRSIFGLKNTHKTTFNAGDLVPIWISEVLPGDTFDINLTSLVRLATPLHPTMDNLFLDTYFFFVPNRLIWDNFTKFMGENDQAWAQDTDSFTPPYVTIGGSFDSSTGTVANIGESSILNYLGLPVTPGAGAKKKVNCTILDFNCYCKIFNDWFRDENLLDEVPIFKGDGAFPANYYVAYVNYLNNNFGVTGGVGINDTGSCLRVARFHDYFSSSLPAPQKGADVLIPAGGEVILDPDWESNGSIPSFLNGNGTQPAGDIEQAYVSGGVNYISVGGASNKTAYDPTGSLLLNGLEITVNNLRLAIQTQKLLEADARGGTRYIELIFSHFGTRSPDARLQRSEYLGGKRTLLNMDEVTQTSSTTSAFPLGYMGGRSVTATNESGFVKSFTEHGHIIGLACVRHSRTYSQGVPRRYSRFSRLKHYWPVFLSSTFVLMSLFMYFAVYQSHAE